MNYLFRIKEENKLYHKPLIYNQISTLFMFSRKNHICFSYKLSNITHILLTCVPLIIKIT